MKTLEEQNQELIEFDKTFNPNDFQSCVNRAVLLLENRAAQLWEEGVDWADKFGEANRGDVETVISKRKDGQTLMAAAIEYVEFWEDCIQRALED